MQLRLIDIAIGLIATFFLVALVASAIVEAVSLILKKRSKDLEVVIGKMLTDAEIKKVKDAKAVTASLQDTSVFQAINAATRRKRGPGSDTRFPSYLSASAFVDAVFEAKQIGTNIGTLAASLPESPFKRRVIALLDQGDNEIVKIKAGLEGWFDDTMDRLAGAYKRWSQWALLVVGLLLAVLLNVSAVRIVDNLWNDSTLRAAIAEQSSNLSEFQCPPNKGDNCTPGEKIETAISSLDGLKLPIGWGDSRWTPNGWGTVIGWVIVGAAVMLGAPFWFDALKRLAGFRAARGIPPKAGDDPTSATSATTTASSSGSR